VEDTLSQRRCPHALPYPPQRTLAVCTVPLGRGLQQEEHTGTGMRMFPWFLLRTYVLEEPATCDRTQVEEETHGQLDLVSAVLWVLRRNMMSPDPFPRFPLPRGCCVHTNEVYEFVQDPRSSLLRRVENCPRSSFVMACCWFSVNPMSPVPIFFHAFFSVY